MNADKRIAGNRWRKRQHAAIAAARTCSPPNSPVNAMEYAQDCGWHGNCRPYGGSRKLFTDKTITMTQQPYVLLDQTEKGKRSMSNKVEKRTLEIAEKLTVAPIARRKVVARRLALPIVVLPLLLTLFTLRSQAETRNWQPVEQIAAAAESFLGTRTGTFAGNTTVQSGNIDSRQRLAYCDEPLVGFLRSGTEIKSRTIVGVRCSGTKPWKVYVPVDVIVTESVLVARRTLKKGYQLIADDLIEERRDVSRLRSGYMSDLSLAVGQRLKTQLIAGKILVPSMFEVDIAIRRGQTVTLTIGSGDFNIATSGTALMDGALNQRIRVQNGHSGRVVEGIVRSREHVEVLLTSINSSFHAETKVSGQIADTNLSNNDS